MTTKEAYQALNSSNRAMADQVINALGYAQAQANTQRSEREAERKESKEKEAK